VTFLIRFFDKTMIMEVAGVFASRHAANPAGLLLRSVTPGSYTE
jgi:hypothetical protein